MESCRMSKVPFNVLISSPDNPFTCLLKQDLDYLPKDTQDINYEMFSRISGHFDDAKI